MVAELEPQSCATQRGGQWVAEARGHRAGTAGPGPGRSETDRGSGEQTDARRWRGSCRWWTGLGPAAPAAEQRPVEGTGASSRTSSRFGLYRGRTTPIYLSASSSRCFCCRSSRLRRTSRRRSRWSRGTSDSSHPGCWCSSGICCSVVLDTPCRRRGCRRQMSRPCGPRTARAAPVAAMAAARGEAAVVGMCSFSFHTAGTEGLDIFPAHSPETTGAGTRSNGTWLAVFGVRCSSIAPAC